MMEPNSQSPTSPEPIQSPPLVGMERRVFVLFSIAVVAVLFVGMVGLLWWRERPAPTALLVLRVPMSEDGATATIDSASPRDLSPIITTLHGNQEVRIPLPPGAYFVKIEKGAKLIHGERFALTDYSYLPLLFDDQPATQPSKSK